MEDETGPAQNPRRVNPTTFVVHGHFYQPPRENPWTEEVPREPSAGAFHDWNQRIAAECYRPNAFARVLDGEGRLLDVVNNYALMSFNVGPTLMSWLERHQPVVYQRIRSAERAGGGGIAQAWNHMILPLASERDARTQVRWGLADFRHRFGAEPAGMWLPETAVNDATLTVLAEEGVGFTILAPGQASGFRPLAGAASPGPAAVPNRDWQPVSAETLDTRLPYRWVHPERADLGVDIVFYAGPLSHDLAFSSMPSETLVDRVASAAGRRGGLVTVALDGETFGHHQKWMDRGLAYALTSEAPRRGIRVSNLATWLRCNRPVREVTVRESAWSCAHGVGRWATDCGCSTGGAPGTDQRWRAPLRAALDLLRDFGAEVFERRGRDLFAGDPWAARDAYVDVLLGAATADDFAHRWVTGDRVAAFTLLEAQRNAMLMYTSCGWFFHDLAGLETIQVMRYAARTMDLWDEAGEPAPRQAFEQVLAGAQSHHEGDGPAVWTAQVTPARVDAARVAAHLVLADLFDLGHPPSAEGNLGIEGNVQGGMDVVTAGSGILASSGRRVTFAWRRVDLTHRRTGRTWDLTALALRLGDAEAVGVVGPGGDPQAAVEILGRALEAGADEADLIVLLRSTATLAGPAVHEFDLGDLLPEAAEALLARSLGTLVRGLSDGAEPVLAALQWTARARAYGAEETAAVPEPVLALAKAAVMARLERDLGNRAFDAAAALARRAESAGLPVSCPARSTVGTALAANAHAAVTAAIAAPGAIPAALAAISLARALCPDPDLDEAQEALHTALVGDGNSGRRRELWPLADALGLSPSLLSGRRSAPGAA